MPRASRPTRLNSFLTYSLRSLAITVLVVASVGVSVPPAEAQTAGCGLTQVAFCDTFDEPSANGAGTRSGDLDGVVWGVSRASQDDNPTQGVLNRWGAANESICGAGTPIGPPRDVRICNGQLVDVLNDNGS